MGSQLPLGAQPPVSVHVYCGQTAGWMRMDEDATWYGSRPRPRPHCVRRGPSSLRKGHSSPPLFGPCLLWPRSPISILLFVFILCYSTFWLVNVCFCCVRFSFSIPSQEIGLGERLRNDLFCVERDVKPELNKSITLSVHLCLQHVCRDAAHRAVSSATADTFYLP